MRSAVKRREDFGFTGLVIELLSAAKRGRGRGPLRSNGKVRWCQTRCDVGVKRTKTHLTYPALCAGPLPLPPRVRRRRRGHLTLGHYLHAVHAAWPSGPYAVGKNYLASTVKRIRLTFLSNVVAYPCRHSRKRIGTMATLQAFFAHPQPATRVSASRVSPPCEASERGAEIAENAEIPQAGQAGHSGAV